MASMIAASPMRKGCAGTSPMCVNGVSSTSHFGTPSSDPTRSHKERDGQQPVCDRGACSWHDRVGKRREPKEQQGDGQAVRASLDHLGEREADPTGLGADPRQQPRRQGDRGGGTRRQCHAPAEPAAASDREREQRLQSLLCLLVACHADLRTREHADDQDEEDEREAEIPGGCDDRAGAELAELTVEVLGDPGGGAALGDHAEDVCERADTGEPHDQAAALRAQRLRQRRGQEPKARLGAARVRAAPLCRCRGWH